MAQDLCIHIPIPFGDTLCLCDEPGMICDSSLAVRRQYIEALSREMLASAGDMEDYRVCAVVMDGGGVQAFPPSELTAFVERLKRSFPMAAQPSIVLGCDPYGIDPVKAANYKQLGATLMEVRLFSSVRTECARVGRGFPHHTLKEIAKALRGCLLNNLGARVALGISGQDRDSLSLTLAQLVEYDVVHVSLIDMGAPPEMADFAEGWLTQRGYRVYAPGKLARPGWEMPFYPLGKTPVLGLGLGAVSLMDGLRAENTHDLALYLEASPDFGRIVQSVKPLQAP